MKFAPYNKTKNKRNDLEELPFKGSFLSLPKDILSAPITMRNNITGKEIELICRAGFIGMEQDEKTYVMKPCFGWYISEFSKRGEYGFPPFNEYNYVEYL